MTRQNSRSRNLPVQTAQNTQKDEFWKDFVDFGIAPKSIDSTQKFSLFAGYRDGKPFVGYDVIGADGRRFCKSNAMVSKQHIAMVKAQLAWMEANCPKEEVKPKERNLKAKQDPATMLKSLLEMADNPEFMAMLKAVAEARSTSAQTAATRSRR